MNDLEVNTLISDISENLLKLSSTLLFFVAVLLMSIFVDCHQVILSIFERRKVNDVKPKEKSSSKKDGKKKKGRNSTSRSKSKSKSSKSKTSKPKSSAKKSLKEIMPKVSSSKATPTTAVPSKGSKSIESKSSASKKNKNNNKTLKPAFSVKSIKGLSANPPDQKSDVNGREDRHPPSSTRGSSSAFVMIG
jgi:hypothetical protein